MHCFDEVLRSRWFVTGQSFSKADITLIAGLIFARVVKLDIPDECEALSA